MMHAKQTKSTIIETPLEHMWDRKDVMLVASGSLPCIRAIWFRARSAGKLHQYRYLAMTNSNYVLGDAEDVIKEGMIEAASVENVAMVVLFLSCPDILIRIDFDDIERTVSEETGKIAKVFFRGPMAGLDKIKRDTVADLMALLPKEEKEILRGNEPLPPPLSDAFGVSDLIRFDRSANLVLTPRGCRSCMEEGDMLHGGNVYATEMEEKDFVFGPEETAGEDARMLAKDYETIYLIGTAVPAFLNFNPDFVRTEVGEEKLLLYFPTDGFHDAFIGVSRAELILLRNAGNKRKTGKKRQVLLAGYSPLLSGDLHQFNRAKKFLEDEGYTLSVPGMTELSPEDTLLVWVVSAAGFPIANWMEKTYGTPVLTSMPLGDHAFESWQKKVKFLLAQKSGREATVIHNMMMTHTRKESVLITGDPVVSMGIAYYLWHEGFSNIKIAVPCWGRETKQLCKEAPGWDDWMVSFRMRRELMPLWQEADLVIADSYLTEVLPDRATMPLPYGLISGRDGWFDGVLSPKWEKDLQSVLNRL
ncbi:MAG: nitrogenase component 1 [Dialister sp.]|nr:nitrogenase component 1 [Dialister sp.]